MKIKPLADRLVIQFEEAATQTPGGILLPDTAKEKPQRAKVLEVGPGKIRDDGVRQAMNVKVGDIVLVSKWSGNEVEIDGQKFTICDEREVLGIVE